MVSFEFKCILLFILETQLTRAGFLLLSLDKLDLIGIFGLLPRGVYL